MQMLRVGFLAAALTGGLVACAGVPAGVDASPSELLAAEPGDATGWNPDPEAAGAAACARAPRNVRAEEVCRRWSCGSVASATPATFSGNLEACSPGAGDADAASRALALVNLHRYLADLPPVTAEPAWAPAAAQCALLAHANEELSHSPPPSWRCWSPLGALTSSVSLIANRSAPVAIGPFFEDPGNEATMVHRRWLLWEGLEAVGIGSTDRYSCVVVDGAALGGVSEAASKSARRVRSARGWAAWPPAGPVPFDVFTAEKLDAIGWTLQSDSAELDHAKVRVFRDEVEVTVTVSHLTPLMGSRSAVRFVPQGWSTKPGEKYRVTSEDGRFDYVVEPLLCP